jgi:hypothetical protein
MIKITESDVADLDRYSASLQQTASAIWGQKLQARVHNEDGTPAVKPLAPSFHSHVRELQ